MNDCSLDVNGYAQCKKTKTPLRPKNEQDKEEWIFFKGRRMPFHQTKNTHSS